MFGFFKKNFNEAIEERREKSEYNCNHIAPRCFQYKVKIMIEQEKDNIFPKRLRRLRLDRDLKCLDVAQGTGLSHTAILGYEDGSQNPKMDSLIKLADYFNVSIDWLTGRTDLRRLPKTVDILMLENKLLELGSYAETFKNDVSERDGE